MLLDRLEHRIGDIFTLNRLYQYMNRTADRGGSFWGCDEGISLGCSLSPLIRAFFLDELDRRMTETGRFYIRFMDDILVFAPTRWKLRRVIGVVNRQVVGSLRLEKHPDKTCIGWIERDFDFSNTISPHCNDTTELPFGYHNGISCSQRIPTVEEAPWTSCLKR